MTTQPDPTRHEASRAAFEAPYKPAHIQRREIGEYFSAMMRIRWEVWCRALDWRDAEDQQNANACGYYCRHCKEHFPGHSIFNHLCKHMEGDVCIWTDNDDDGCFDTACKHSLCYEEPPDVVHFPFCPACGRRVKIQNFDDNSVGDNQKTTL